MTKTEEMVRQVIEQFVVAMYRAGLDQQGLAEASGVKPSTVSRYLNGKDMRFSTMDKLAEGLGLEWTGVDGLRLVPRREQ